MATNLKILFLHGGPDSGNYGHEGRPGHVGGSKPDDSSLEDYSSKSKLISAIESGEFQLDKLTWEKQPRISGSLIQRYKANFDNYELIASANRSISYGNLKGSRLRDTRKTRSIVDIQVDVRDTRLGIGTGTPVSLFYKVVKGEGIEEDNKHRSNVEKAKQLFKKKFGFDIIM